MGGGHFQREHEAFGLDFGVTPGARLDRLDEALGLIRRLLDGELVTHHGRYYDFVDALCEPRPIQAARAVHDRRLGAEEDVGHRRAPRRRVEQVGRLAGGRR